MPNGETYTDPSRYISTFLFGDDMQTSGVVLDFYDDISGTGLKKAFPSATTLPDVIKTAHILNPEEREAIRDEAFALVLVNEGSVMRKFACIDPGNTALSVVYFLQNGTKLPEEAQKTAAANITAACEEFGLPVHPLIAKIASGDMVKSPENKAACQAKKAASKVRTRDPLRQPAAGDEVDWAERTNIMGGSGDYGQVSRVADSLNMKTASRVVDVTGQAPKAVTFKKEAQRTALRGRYALDSLTDVQTALGFFDENYVNMDPVDRHEFAVKTASRAMELGLPTSELLHRYGSTEYSDEVDAHVQSRMSLTDDEDAKAVYSELLEKRAHIDPEKFAEILGEVDIVAGLNWHYGNTLADPYFATFGGWAHEKAASWTWSGSNGDHVTAEQLNRLAKEGRQLMLQKFSSSIVDGFQKDPVNVFQSMPEPQKVLFSRLANSVAEGV